MKKEKMKAFLLAFVAMGWLNAQSQAGGDWTYRIKTDQMNDGIWHTFTLLATEPVGDGVLSGVPRITITCGKGFSDTTMLTPTIVANRMVELSVDGKRKLKSWGSSTDGKAYFIQDISAIGATKEILRSGDFRVGFFDALGHFYVAKFKPAGIDRAMVAKYCGEKFLKP